MPILDECGITKEDVIRVKESWTPIYEDKEKSGVFLFKVMFELYPDYENYFIKFKKEGENSIFENKSFQHHVKHLVMDALDDILSNLENEEALKQKLKTLALNHSKRNIKKEQFQAIGKVLLETLKRALNDKYTAELEDSWTKIVICSMNQIGKVTG